LKAIRSPRFVVVVNNAHVYAKSTRESLCDVTAVHDILYTMHVAAAMQRSQLPFYQSRDFNHTTNAVAYSQL